MGNDDLDLFHVAIFAATTDDVTGFVVALGAPHRVVEAPHRVVATVRPRIGCVGTLIVILLLVWLVLAVLGFVIHGLFWLAILGIVLFLATGIWGWLRRRAASS